MGRLLILAFAVAAIGLTGCDDTLDRPIHFVIPDGFTGPFVLVAHPSNPDAIVRHSDRYEISIPSDGILRTKSTAIFTRWHKTRATFSSGKRLSSQDRDAIGLYAGPTSTSGISWYYVGTYEEFRTFMYGDVHDRNRREWLRERGLAD
jgi:hypothetical protein